jgi:hypothetical protein
VCRVAKLAGIPPKSQPLFCHYLLGHVESARHAGPDAVLPQPQLSTWLKPIAKQAATLRNSLLSLGDDERKVVAAMLGCNILTSFSFVASLDAIAEGGKALEARAKALSGKERPQTPKALGAPPKPLPWKPGAPVPEAFVAALIGLVDQFGGMPLTLFRDGTKGTLIEAMDWLAPHLPDGFFDLKSGALESVRKEMRTPQPGGNK